MTITRTFAPVIMAALLMSALPLPAAAAGKLEVSGWIPYWRTDAGTKDAKKNLSTMKEINPFAYSVRTDGTLADTLKIEGKNWQSLIKAADKKRVRVVPTVMWSDTNTIHAVLSDPARRAAHIAAIVAEVEKRDFDGVDIDYEGKLAETRPHFSAFLKELSEELDGKHLSCTIEARMPLSARYAGTPPPGIEYANDLPEINKHCDRVKVMTYDQQTADVELNAAARKTNDVYAPVADVEWVEKVVDYMGEDIDTRKMVIGIPTYGYIYQVMPNTTGVGYGYIKMEAFNPKYATDLAKKLKITPERNSAGEMSFTYVPKDQNKSLPSQAELARLAPRGTSSANLAAAGALALVKKEGRQAPVQYLTWSDAGAIKQKVDLAKRLGVAGVAVFKIDGGSDPKMWSALK
ncbi:MAG TPA: glycosyl hydrolase family 18 protein [Candidatus Paceibacterota bacterium]|nr:glycosyl hydrolase family 18 protein [Candidatus Paceibacterota bacterium]